MYRTKALLATALLAGTSSAQAITTITDASCVSSANALRTAGPQPPADVLSYLAVPLGYRQPTGTEARPTTTLPPDTLQDPEGFVEVICGIVPELPASVLPEFKSWGSALMSYGRAHLSEYDAFVTQCVTTGEAAESITSYLNSLLTGTGALCKPTATATSTPSGVSNGTVSVTPTPYPTVTGASSTSTSPLTAAAARPTGVIAGAAALGGIIGAAALL
ncbi:hypothetical protein F4777DRAFT_579356 [Nemania sp. FL0916]|nr:hypothetical protein F4777DRAFT_579356 [Nemania sp. FL0916]